MKKYLPALAVISAAVLWSLDGYIRQNLSTLPSFLIISLEHVIGAIIFFPLLLKGWNEIVIIRQRGWISILWISICGGILGTFLGFIFIFEGMELDGAPGVDPSAIIISNFAIAIITLLYGVVGATTVYLIQKYYVLMIIVKFKP